MKKKTYMKPQTCIVLLRGPLVMLSGSNNVIDYDDGYDIIIGDEDDGG